MKREPATLARVRVYSFPAVVQPGARILILGSMPGVASLSAHQYYAHPRNQFWTIVQQVAAVTASQDYEDRLQVLRDHRLALWDVLHSCIRPGSLDASIEHHTAKPNDLTGLLRQYPGIRRICCNGGMAHTALQRHFGRILAENFPQIDVVALPSTSPANASWTFARKLAAWRKGLEPAFRAPSAIARGRG